MVKNLGAILIGFVVMAGFNGLNQTASGQNNPTKLREKYLTPPEDILNEVLAPRYKNITIPTIRTSRYSHRANFVPTTLGPKRKYFLHYISKENLAPIDGFGKRHYNLGGLQIDPEANRRRMYSMVRGYGRRTKTYAGLEIINARDGKKHRIQTPDNAPISNAKWSPAEGKIAYYAHFDKATYIYVADVTSGQSHRVTKQPVLATLNRSFEWSADGRFIFTVLIPHNRGAAPHKPKILLPQIRVTTHTQKRLRTFPSLLKGPYQVKLLKYYVTGQLARINVSNRKVRKIGKPAMIRDIDVAPSGKYIIIQTLQTPFSYTVPVNNFAHKKEIWNLRGKAMAVLQGSDVNLGIPNHNINHYPQRKDIKWRPDGGGVSMIRTPKIKKTKDPTSHELKAHYAHKNHVGKGKYSILDWKPPFGQGDQTSVYKSDNKIEKVSYGEGSDALFINGRSGGKKHLFAFFPEQSDTTYSIYTYDTDDFYKNPGNLLYVKGKNGLPVVKMTPGKQDVFLLGTKYDKNPEKNAPRSFIDRVDIKSGKKQRIFQSSPNVYENFVAALDDHVNQIVVSRQSSKIYPNYWIVNLSSGKKNKITSNRSYNKDITSAQRHRFKVRRADGITFWVNVILPKNWSGKPLPGIIYQYPTEYDGQKDYDKSKRYYNKNEYPRIFKGGWPERAPEILIKRGYAVIKADWPIVSNQGTPDDGLVWSIQQNCTALIDSLASKGYVERDRMAIIGHSFGAFGVVNSMVHTSFFKAGIAGDDAYNRTLTPFGFQRQHHILWNDLGKYIELSPYFWADHLDGALMMYHDAEDQNVGTWPIQSWRLFKALNKLGKNAALYYYPYGDHHTGAEEIVLDRWTRWLNWLDHYLKGSGKHVSETALGK